MKMVRELKGHKKTAWKVAFDPAGDRLASCAPDGTIRLWDVAKGESVRTMSGPRTSPSAVAFTPDGRQLVGSGADETVRIWEVATGREVKRLAEVPSVSAIEFSRDGKHFAVAGSKVIKIFSAAKQAELLELTGHEGRISAIAFAPDNRRLVSVGYEEKTIRVW